MYHLLEPTRLQILVIYYKRSCVRIKNQATDLLKQQKLIERQSYMDGTLERESHVRDLVVLSTHLTSGESLSPGPQSPSSVNEGAKGLLRFFPALNCHDYDWSPELLTDN